MYSVVQRIANRNLVLRYILKERFDRKIFVFSKKFVLLKFRINHLKFFVLVQFFVDEQFSLDLFLSSV